MLPTIVKPEWKETPEIKALGEKVEQLAHRVKREGIGSLKNANGDINPTSLGYEYFITTLTWIRKRLVTQKFYEEAPSESMPVIVGEGAFMDNIVTNLGIITGGNSFEESIVNQGGENSRFASVQAGLVPVTIPVLTSVLALGYSLIQVEQALRTNWNYMENLEKSRLKMFQLGIQRIAFLGVQARTDMPGLYTQGDVNVNLNLLMTTKLSSMTAAQLQTFCGALLAAYRANCNNTAWPNHFKIPMNDYVGLGTASDPSFPIITKLEYLSRMFDAIVPGGVKITGSAYGQASLSGGELTYDRVILYRDSDEESLAFNVPVWYTPTQPATNDNFNFQSVAYSQFSSPKAYRPLEMFYIDHS